MKHLRNAAIVIVVMSTLALSSCAEKAAEDTTDNTKTGATAKAEQTSAIPAEFYLEPLYEGCDKFADLDTTDLLGEKLVPVSTLDSSTDAACVWSLAGDDGSAPAAQVEVGIDMLNEDDIWTDYATFDAADWWMHETREVPQDAPWWGFASYWDWSTDAGYSPLVQLNRSDESMLRLSCEYRGEPQAIAEESTSALLDEAASVEGDLHAFCTEALDHAIVKTN